MYTFTLTVNKYSEGICSHGAAHSFHTIVLALSVLGHLNSFTILVLKFENKYILLPADVCVYNSAGQMANSVDYDETPRSVASDLRSHYLL